MYKAAAEYNQLKSWEWVIALEAEMPMRQIRENQVISESEIISNRVRQMGLRMPNTTSIVPESNSISGAVDALFYVPTPCEKDCTAMFSRLRTNQARNKVGSIQVVFVDLNDTEEGRQSVYQWAASHELSTNDVGPDKNVRISFESSL